MQVSSFPMKLSLKPNRAGDVRSTRQETRDISFMSNKLQCCVPTKVQC